jgi:hypothetical protein
VLWATAQIWVSLQERLHDTGGDTSRPGQVGQG